MPPRFKVAIILLVSATASCAVLAPVSARKKPRPTPTPQATPTVTPLPTATPTREQQDVEAISEAVLLHWFGPGGSQGHKFYLSLGGQDPTPAFTERMARQAILFDPISLCPDPHARGRGAERIRQPPLSISKPQWISPVKVEIDYDTVVSGSSFVVEKQEDKWKVTKRKRRWIA